MRLPGAADAGEESLCWMDDAGPDPVLVLIQPALSAPSAPKREKTVFFVFLDPGVHVMNSDLFPLGLT